MQKIVVKGTKKIPAVNLKELFSYRELLWVLAIKEYQIRYKQTMIGVLWAIFRPLLTMVVFSILFGKVAQMPSGGFPYPIFSYSGLLLWNYFSTSITMGSNSMVYNSKLVTKVYFPRIIIPTASTIVSLVDYFIAFLILLILFPIYHVQISSSIFLLPLVLFGTFLLAVGISFWTSAINVKYRDVQFALPFLIQILMYLTPVIYPISFAGRYKLLLMINPISGYLEAHRAVLLSTPVDWTSLGISFGLTIIILISGYMYFKSVEKYFADII